MVERVATSRNRIDVVLGAAGSGKTYALDALRDAFEASGHQVYGAALAATAAQGLQHGAGIPSTTIRRLVGEQNRPPWGLDYRTVLVLDEAAMIGTRQLAPIIDAAERAHAKIVLVGDPKQLPEIDAGGTFAAIAKRIPISRLTDNHRQTDPHERDALAALRTGHIDLALHQLHRAICLD
jgi:ATP-dependent exoDNAse (exonuclease V) alpha subunit